MSHVGIVRTLRGFLGVMDKKVDKLSGTTVRSALQFVRVCGAREHNLKNVDVDIPWDSLVVFSDTSGSGKSSRPSGHCTPRLNAGIWNRYRPMPGGCFTRWRCRKSMRSKAFRRLSRSNSSAARRRRDRASEASPHSRTCCGSCTPVQETIRKASRPTTAERCRGRFLRSVVQDLR